MSQGKFWLQKIWSGVKDWRKRNWKMISKVLAFLITSILFIISIIVPLIIYINIAKFFGVLTIFAKETILKSLIEVEATILGFLGLIVVYMLTSLDTKEDRYEQMRFHLQTKGQYKEVPPWRESIVKNREITEKRITVINGVLSQVHKQRRTTISSSSTTGIQLVISILLSIWTLGISDSELAGCLSVFAVWLFVGSVVNLFWMLRTIAKISYVHA